MFEDLNLNQHCSENLNLIIEWNLGIMAAISRTPLIRINWDSKQSGYA
jgi:hypothetical protein